MSHIATHTALKPSLFQQWDPRCKIVGLFILLAAYSFVQQLLILLPMFAVTLLVAGFSRRSATFFLQKLRYPSLLILVLVLALPFISGAHVVVDFGFVQMNREGLQAAGLIAGRFLCILTTAMVLLNASPFLVNIKAMRALGLPWIMADMALLVYRYLEVLGSDLRRMRTSMQIRGFKGHKLNFETIKTLAWLAGSLILHSYERADWIYRAMRLRGYGRSELLTHDFQIRRADVLLLGLFATAAAAFVVMELMMR